MRSRGEEGAPLRAAVALAMTVAVALVPLAIACGDEIPVDPAPLAEGGPGPGPGPGTGDGGGDGGVGGNGCPATVCSEGGASFCDDFERPTIGGVGHWLTVASGDAGLDPGPRLVGPSCDSHVHVEIPQHDTRTQRVLIQGVPEAMGDVTVDADLKLVFDPSASLPGSGCYFMAIAPTAEAFDTLNIVGLIASSKGVEMGVLFNGMQLTQGTASAFPIGELVHVRWHIRFASMKGSYDVSVNGSELLKVGSVKTSQDGVETPPSFLIKVGADCGVGVGPISVDIDNVVVHAQR